MSGPVADGGPPLVGILAIQGDFAAHAAMLHGLGAPTREVRIPADLSGLEALVLPGGESTVMSLGLEREGLAGPLHDLIAAGTPTLGTCAGMIMLDRAHLDVLPMRARRNAFGRQTRSFEAEIELAGVGPLRGVFIRAPWIEAGEDGIEVLAAIDGHPVAVRRGDILAVSFHPELAGDDRLHRWLLDAARRRRA